MTVQNLTAKVRELYRFPVKSLGGEALREIGVSASGFAGDRLWAFRDIGRNEITSAKRSPLLLQISARSLEGGQALLSLPTGQSVRTDAPDCAEIISAFIGRPQKLFSQRPASDTAHYARAAVAPEQMESSLREALALLPDEPLPDFSKFPAEIFQYKTVPGSYFDGAVIHIILASEMQRLQNTLPGVAVSAPRFRPNIVLDDLGAPLCATDLIGKKIQIGAVALSIDYMVPRCSMTTHQQDDLGKAPEIMRKLVRDWQNNFGVYGSVLKPGQIRIGEGAAVVA